MTAQLFNGLLAYRSMIFDPQASPEEQEFDRALRPSSFDEFVGQDDVCDNLKIAIEAARQRHEPLDHVLLVGPPGLGKTTLAHLIATGMETTILITSGPALAAPRELAGPLTRLERGDVFFVSSDGSSLFLWGLWSRRSSLRPAALRRRPLRRPGAGRAWW